MVLTYLSMSMLLNYVYTAYTGKLFLIVQGRICAAIQGWRSFFKLKVDENNWTSNVDLRTYTGLYVVRTLLLSNIRIKVKSIIFENTLERVIVIMEQPENDASLNSMR